LPIRVVGAALDVVDCLAIEFKRKAQFHQRPHLALPGENAVPLADNRTQMSGADRGERDTRRSLYIDHPPPGEIAFEGASCFLFNLSPRRIRNGG
jgi:hypothetical protein